MPEPLSPAPIRLLVVDDHPMVREGLRSMLGGTDVP
jgi:DNA-binding NarL/FixJ family response regulator